ncbi:MAG: DUF4785 domain-containing protein, partial [Pseudomonadota bacterium]
MKTSITALLLSLGALVGPAAGLADSGTLRYAEGEERVPRVSSASSTETLVNTNRERLQYTWLVDADAELRQNPFTARSRGYRLTVSGAELNRGATLVIDAPGAVVYLSPASGAAALEIEKLHVVSSDGRRHSAGDGLRRAADGAALRASGAPFASGGVAFELAARVGAGRLTVQSATALRADDSYVVQVLDRNSALELSLAGAREVFLENGKLAASAWLTRAGHSEAMTVLDSYLVSPSGRREPVAFAAAGGRAALSHRVPAAEPRAAGLWELHVTTRAARSGVLRTAKTAFAVARPTARFAGSYRSWDQLDAGVVLALGLEIGAAGRYEVRAVLRG